MWVLVPQLPRANSTVCFLPRMIPHLRPAGDDAPLEIDEILERDGEAMERSNAVASAEGLARSFGGQPRVQLRRSNARSGPDGGRLERHPRRAPHQVELEIDELGRAVFIRFRADSDQTVAQPSLERAESLPLQPVDRVPRRVRLRDDVAREPPSPVVVVTLAAGQVELALAAMEDRAASIQERLRALIDRRQGQLNLACSQCHDDHWGRRLAGNVIPQAHPTGYPLYRLEWQGLGSLQRRLRNCLVGIRAEPYE